PRMKLGVMIGYWGFGMTAEAGLEIAQAAERLGYDSLWTAEAYGSDAATPLAWLAAGTSRIKLGAGIFQIPARSAAMTAMTAATWLPVFCSPEHTSTLREPLEEGAHRAGRSLDGFQVCPTVNVMITEDLESARNAMRPMLALYVGGMGSREQNFYNRLISSYGFEREARHVQDLYLEGRRVEAMDALPDEMIDKVSIAGPPAKAKEKIREFRDAGVDTLVVAGMAVDTADRIEQMRLVAELAQEVESASTTRP